LSMYKIIEVEATFQIKGMVAKVQHLVRVVEN
jgi:ribosomal protein L30/L7E